MLVDAGDGISKALLAQNVHHDEIDGIVITHLHPDHFSGLASLIIQMKMSRRTKQLDLFCSEDISENLKTYLKISYVDSEKLDFELKINRVQSNFNVVVSPGLSFIARKNTHLIHYEEEFDKERLSSSCISLLFQFDGKNIFYTGDIGGKNDLNLFQDYPIDIIIAEVTHVDLKYIIDFALKKGINKILLTHIPDELEKSLSRTLSELSAGSPIDIMLAYDGMTYNIQ
jgi:ribonuclease BN (tRNA processing enzyme)